MGAALAWVPHLLGSISVRERIPFSLPTSSFLAEYGLEGL